MLSAAALAGWLAGSALSPPVAVTQVTRPRPPAAPIAPASLPRVMWPVARLPVAPPAPSRNPFAFRSSERVVETHRSASLLPPSSSATGAQGTLDHSAPAPPPRWRLSGIAANEDGDIVAVISGAGDVFLMRAGDELPGGDAIEEVGAAHVVVRTAGGPLTLRLP